MVPRSRYSLGMQELGTGERARPEALQPALPERRPVGVLVQRHLRYGKGLLPEEPEPCPDPLTRAQHQRYDSAENSPLEPNRPADRSDLAGWPSLGK